MKKTVIVNLVFTYFLLHCAKTEDYSITTSIDIPRTDRSNSPFAVRFFNYMKLTWPLRPVLWVDKSENIFYGSIEAGIIQDSIEFRQPLEQQSEKLFKYIYDTVDLSTQPYPWANQKMSFWVEFSNGIEVIYIFDLNDSIYINQLR